MLVLTHGSPADETQRRVFGILHGLGLGDRRRRGLAVLGDGFERFGPIAGVVCTPEAIAVLATRHLDGADGYLFAPLRGGWTIGGVPARLDGSGENPVHAVDAALGRVVAAVRRGGLDPGYVQSLIVVDGPVTGVAQPEPERGTGVVVSPARSDELVEAIGVATSRREAGVQGIWTTADITGLLESLGFAFAELDTRLLTDEGFPYSPYVLRQTSPDDIPFSRPESIPGATRSLRSHDATAEPVSVASVLDAASDPDLRSASGDRPAGPPTVPVAEIKPTGPAALLREPGEEPEAHRSPWRWIIPIVVLALVIAGVWLGASRLFSKDDGSPEAGPGSAASSAPPADQTAGGLGFRREATDQQTDCAAHAYGEVQQLLANQPCVQMTRAVFTTTVDGKPAVVSVIDVEMSDEAGAGQLKAATDTDGTGNVNDLLREGGAPAGIAAPEVLTDGHYASSIDGAHVRICEIGFADGSKPTEQLDLAAESALSLELG